MVTGVDDAVGVGVAFLSSADGGPEDSLTAASSIAATESVFRIGWAVVVIDEQPERMEEGNYAVPLAVRAIDWTKTRRLVVVLRVGCIGPLHQNGPSGVGLGADMIAHKRTTVSKQFGKGEDCNQSYCSQPDEDGQHCEVLLLLLVQTKEMWETMSSKLYGMYLLSGGFVRLALGSPWEVRSRR